MADSPKTKKKRLVKNPETFRERATKVTADAEKPRRGAGTTKHAKQGLGKVFRPIGRAIRFIFYRQPFKLIGRIIVPRYLRNSWRELRLVKWPSRRESRDLTSAVLVFAVIFGAVIAVVDYGLDKLFRGILLK